MVIHYFDSRTENKSLCNTKNSNKSTKNINEVTCEKCLATLETERLLSIKNSHEGEIIANDIYSKYGRIPYKNDSKQSSEKLSEKEILKRLYKEQKHIEKKYSKRLNKNAYWYDKDYQKNDKEIKSIEESLNNKNIF